MWTYGVIPFTMESVWTQVDCIHFLVAYFSPFLVLIRIKPTLYIQSSFSFRGRDEAHYRLVCAKRLAAPVFGNERK